MIRLLLAVVVAALLAACGDPSGRTGVGGLQPRDGKSGLALTGTVGGRQVAVSAGAPRLLLDDCDVNNGLDVDVCFFAADIDGTTFGLIFENPDVLAAGSRLEVVPSDCTADACDDVAGAAVVDVQRGTGEDRVRAIGGNVVVDVADKGLRYAGRIDLTLSDGRLGGTFDVVPRPDEDET